MVERVLIALILVLAGACAFGLLKGHQMHRASRATVATGKPTIVYFRNDACVPCVTQARYVQQLEAQFGDRIVVEKLDAGADQPTAERYGVFTVPTVLVVNPNGVVRYANYGLTDAGKLAAQLRSVQPQLAS